MDTTTETSKDRRIAIHYSWPGTLHDNMQIVANARFGRNRSAAAEHFINVGVLADSEEVLPAALVEQLSELAGRQGLPFLKLVENAVAAGLPVLREDAAAASIAR